MSISINLHDKWRYELDEADRGIGENWASRTLAGEGFAVPGTTAGNKLGDPVSIDRKLTREAVRCLREEYKYVGAAWYQTGFCVKDSCDKKQAVLFLERIMFESRAWIDGHYISSRDSLSTPHQYDITKYITPGREQSLTVRVDNRDIHKISPYPSAYTDETQTIWNGIAGRCEININDAVTFDKVITGVSLQKKEISISFDLENSYGTDVSSVLAVRIKKEERTLAGRVTEPFKLGSTGHADIILPLTDAITLWDEFNPVLYSLEIELSEAESGTVLAGYSRQTGFRHLGQTGGILQVNGLQRFLRGNLDCCVYPLTGHPPMETEHWKEVFARTKAYGLNHIRFHSWCPPEAAFEAADQLGLYLQVEGPVWMDTWMGCTVGSHEEHYGYLPEEALRIINTYSIHPSFLIFSNGNELNGDFVLLESIIERLRKQNPHILYTLSTNWDRQMTGQDDLFITQSVDGTGIRGQFYLDRLVTGTLLDYSEAVKKREIPVLAHEVGQYAVYPNAAEIPKFTGVLKPVNYEVIKEDLKEKQLFSYLPGFVRASGRLSWALYKAELEAALRTKGFGGLQLLGLQDFPGQSTATIGVLDCFFDSKGYGSEEEFRGFCNSTVVLARMDKFLYKTTENFVADIEVAHYGSEALRDVRIIVSLEEHHGDILWTGTFMAEEIPVGLYTGNMHVDEDIFASLKGKSPLILKAGIHNTEYWNSWDIWVYEETIASANCYPALTVEAMEKLQRGEKVLLLPKAENLKNTGPGKFFPVFWSPVHFTSTDPCGMIIDNRNPLFSDYYPSGDYADFEWKNILENSVSVNLDHLPGFDPVTLLVPNFFNNHKFSNLFEARVLNGSVLVCSLDLDTGAEDHIERRSLKQALFRYFASEDFNPQQRIDIDSFKDIFLI